MEIWMKRPILVSVLFIAATVALGAQQASQPSPYQGTSNPPPDDQIVTSAPPQAKPPAGKPLAPAPAAPPSASADSAASDRADGMDEGVVDGAQPAPAQPVPSEEPGLSDRAYAADPDGDIVHPQAPRSGEIPEGTTIRVRLLRRLSTAYTEKGEDFRSRVASDVLEGGQVLIPAGAEIDGRVVEVSSGHTGGHGSMRLRPETVILPDGTRYRLHAEVTGTPGSRTRVGSEGAITPDSRLKRDGIEYGGAVGAGATTGAILGGPAGALTGSLIGAGVVTAHLLISHPQATLEAGTAMLFTLSEPLQLVPARTSGN
jgi:hypothetical protein